MEEKKQDDWRTGRPNLHHRDKKIGFRISDSELELLAECAALTGTTRAQTIITALELLKKTLST